MRATIRAHFNLNLITLTRSYFITKKLVIYMSNDTDKELYDMLRRRNNTRLQTFAVKVSWTVASWETL